jgi:hypothetical protein
MAYQLLEPSQLISGTVVLKCLLLFENTLVRQNGAPKSSSCSSTGTRRPYHLLGQDHSCYLER